MKVRIIGEYDADQVSHDTGLRCEDESLTQQEFKDESDINTIIDRFGIGENPIQAQKWVTDLDIENAPNDYMQVMNQLNEARDQFMTLPAKLRSQFDNQPGQFVSFVSDPGNFDEMVRLGLATPRPDPVPSDTDRIIEAVKASRTIPS